MKKVLTILSIIFTVTITHAQELLSKKGTPVLPQPKDWSIGFDADPFLKYLGNFFNKDANNNTLLSPQIPLTLVGLYVKDERTAYRLKVRIGLGSRTVNNFVDDDEYTGAPPNAKTTDTWKRASTNLFAGVGLQKSRGNARLRGIYGAELGLGYSSSTDSYTYGNSFSQDNSDPTSTLDWNQTDTTGNFLSGPASSRISKIKSPSEIMILVNGFIGAEYFFAPKMSISAEYGWGVEFTGMGERETFTVNADGSSGKETSTRNGKITELTLDVRDVGAITLHLYF
jgi:hypothetical protein